MEWKDFQLEMGKSKPRDLSLSFSFWRISSVDLVPPSSRLLSLDTTNLKEHSIFFFANEHIFETQIDRLTISEAQLVICRVSSR